LIKGDGCDPAAFLGEKVDSGFISRASCDFATGKSKTGQEGSREEKKKGGRPERGD